MEADKHRVWKLLYWARTVLLDIKRREHFCESLEVLQEQIDAALQSVSVMQEELLE